MPGLLPGPELLLYALSRGINFIDTAESYDNYAILRAALRGWKGEVVLATKSYAYTREDMEKSLVKALKELGRERIEVFLLHEQESALTIQGHLPALKYLIEAKEKGLVRAVGISTHAVAAVEAASEMEEIDVIHPLINLRGLGIIDGSLEDMLRAVERAWQKGKGIYAMKALGGGHLIPVAEEALRFVFSLPYVDAVAVGMATPEEVKAGLRLAEGKPVPERLSQHLNSRPRRLLVEEWCSGCGLCVARCRHKALELAGGRVRVRQELCVLCGYCAFVCRDFCLKVV
jgi:predicted aldo/keto reductase-like oxidoreductase